MYPASWIAPATAPLDALRRATLALAARSSLLRRCFLQREHRVAAGVVLHASLAFLGAVFFPMLLLLVGPVVLGVPHLAADVRHLVVRREHDDPRGRTLGFGLGLSLFLVAWGAPLLPGVGPETATRLTLVTADLWLLVFLLRGGNGPLGWRRGVALLLASALTLVGCLFPRAFRLVFAHAHNVIGFLVVAALVRQRRRLFLGLLTFVLGLAACLMSGAFAELTLASAGVTLGHTHLFVMADGLAPGLGALPATALTTTFAFLQSVHYAVWLFVIPELDRARAGSTTVRTRVTSYFADFGPLGVLAIVLLTALLVGGACVSLYGACMTYLSAAAFHGYLELVLLAAWYLRAHPKPAERVLAAEGSH